MKTLLPKFLLPEAPPEADYEREVAARKDWQPGENAIGLLSQRANAGDANAAWELARLAIRAVRAVNRIAEAKPQLLHAFAWWDVSWPVMKSCRDQLSGKEKKLFAALGVGKRALVEVDPQSAKWVLDDVGRVAFRLLAFVDRQRRMARVRKVNRARPPHPYKLHLAYKRLEAFSDDTSDKWWNVAETVFLNSYPDPAAVPRLAAMTSCGKKPRTPGRIRYNFMQALKKRFLSFAPNTSYQT